MKRNLRTFSGLVAVVLLVGLAAAPELQAQDGEEFECSNATLKGMYGFSETATSRISRRRPGIEDEFHIAAVGFIVADGMGNITADKSTAVSDRDPPSARGGFAGSFVSDITEAPFELKYTVNPDCTGTFSLLFPDGTQRDVGAFVLVNGGREGWRLGTTGPQISVLIFKRIDVVDEQHDAKVDALAEELAFMKGLVRRIALHLGVLRRGE